jgi:GNAT superfamily N-acetyltransferase
VNSTEEQEHCLPKEPNIERATTDDALEILNLQRLCFYPEAELYHNYDLPPLKQSLSEVIEQFQSHTFLVIRLNEQIIASVRATCYEGKCQIGRLVVHPAHQGKGLGTRMMGAIEVAFPKGNLRLYRRLGYREFKRERLLVFLAKRNSRRTEL